MIEEIYALDFGTSTVQWSRVAVRGHGAPVVGSRIPIPNVIQVRDERMVSFGFDAEGATFRYLDQTYSHYKMHLNRDGNYWWSREVSPEKLTQMVFDWLLKDPLALPASGYEPQKPLFIGVPGHWDPAGEGRSHLADAARQAGAKTIHFIHEPYAALLWWLHQHGHHAKRCKSEYSLVYDFGGGTLDIAIIAEYDAHDELKHGAHVLGGMDFDRRLAEHFEESIKREVGAQRLCIADHLTVLRSSRVLKEKLSGVPETGVEIRRLEALPRGCDFDMTRVEFEDVCASEVQACIDSVTQTLSRAGVSPNSVGRVILTGGSARLWFLVDRLHGVFPHLERRDFCVSETPQFDVALGAAIFGAKYYAEAQPTSFDDAPAKAPSDEAIEELVLGYAVGTGVAVAAVPVPLLDLVAGVGLNWKMISDVGKRYGRFFGEQAATALGQEILKCLAGMGVVFVISSVLKIAFIGAFLQAGVAGYITFITGLAAREYFKFGDGWGAAGAEEVIARLKEQHPPLATIKRIARLVNERHR